MAATSAGSTGGNRRQIGIEARLCGIGGLLGAGELGDRRIDDPVLQIAKVLAGRIGVLDDRDKRRLLGKAVRDAGEFADQERGGNSEDREQQDG